MLEISGLSVAYGGLHALTEVSLTVREGQFVTVVGPNGAGKSTLFKTISGIVPPVAGTIRFDGADLLALPAARRAHLGIAHVPEGRQVFRTLTVRENLEMGAYTASGTRQWHHTIERIHTLFPILASRADQLAGTLSGGQQRQLEIARALLTDPTVMLIDEPTASVEPRVTAQIYELIAGLAAQGKAILLVDQNIKGAIGISDHVYVMRTGTLLEEGPRSRFTDTLEMLVSRWLYTR